ncbi:hypothetical protein AB0346_23490 [Nocardia beijingensis]|uniref:hypothetical protein n=1 Tax=Nocardia beijingensis TaxID=95162 RepID=UPI00344BBCBF
MFQTVRWWQIAGRFASSALFGIRDGMTVDKLALRLACAELLPSGVKHLAWAVKSPIQRSSGLISVLATAARSHAAGLPGARTYSDPVTEDAEAVAARLYLSIVENS